MPFFQLKQKFKSYGMFLTPDEYFVTALSKKKRPELLV